MGIVLLEIHVPSPHSQSSHPRAGIGSGSPDDRLQERPAILSPGSFFPQQVTDPHYEFFFSFFLLRPPVVTEKQVL